MLFEIKDLAVRFGSGPHAAQAVRGVSLGVDPGETAGLVGESGCGKSVTSLAALRLLESPPAQIHSGAARLDGTDLLTLGAEGIRSARGREIAMIFQEPMTSFNPVFTVGDQLAEAILVHERVPPEEAEARAVAMLREVGIPEPERRMEQYPHELSGGMKQRAMIAMALLCGPKILIADEPTTALDVTVQAQILALLLRLQEERGMGILLITHDLAVVAESCRRVYVMYAGRIVEEAGAEELFAEPLHPYTQGLFRCLPRVDAKAPRLSVIPGSVPDPARIPSGCAFHPRCPRAVAECARTDPMLETKRPGRRAACLRVPVEGGGG